MSYLEAAIDCCLAWAPRKKSTSPGKRAPRLPRHRRTENAAGHTNERCCAHQARSHHSRPQQGALGRRRMGKNRIPAKERQGSHRSSGFHEPRLSHLHTHRKLQVHSFEVPACFSLMNSHLSMLPLAGFRCQNKPGVYSWLLPPLFGAVPRGT